MSHPKSGWSWDRVRGLNPRGVAVQQLLSKTQIMLTPPWHLRPSSTTCRLLDRPLGRLAISVAARRLRTPHSPRSWAVKSLNARSDRGSSGLLENRGILPIHNPQWEEGLNSKKKQCQWSKVCPQLREERSEGLKGALLRGAFYQGVAEAEVAAVQAERVLQVHVTIHNERP